MDTAITTNDIDVKIPANYNGSTVRVIVDKEKVKDDKDPTFISFDLNFQDTYVTIGDKQIEMGAFYHMLRKEGGLSDRIPLTVNLQPFYIRNFDSHPPCYGGKRVWPFKWKDVHCSLAITSSILCIRVHDKSLKESVATLIDIRDEALKLWKDEKPAQSLRLYTIVKQPGHYAWQEHSTRTKRKLETIYIEKDVKDRLVSRIEKFLGASALYDKYGATWKKVIIFDGPPGTGKTSTVLALASHFDRGISKMTITADMTSSQLESLFRNVPKQSFLLLEDVDALFVERKATSLSQVDFSTVLNLMDGITTTRGLILFMTTNHIEKLDSAFVRPGRVDDIVHFKPAGVEEWRNAIQMLGDRWPHEHDAYLELLSERKTHCSIADIQSHLFECLMEERESILSYKK